MKRTWITVIPALLFFPVIAARGQGMQLNDPPNAPSPSQTNRAELNKGFAYSNLPASGRAAARSVQPGSPSFTIKDKFRFYAGETFLNPSVLTAPAFRAGIRMANPPTRGAYTYPDDWRQGAEGFGRNLGDAVAERTSAHTARFLTGVITREDPRYFASSSHNVFARSFHALGFTFVDRSDSGHLMPAISNLAGAAAGGAVGMAYLPSGFDNVSYAGRRAAVDLGALAGRNLFSEFAPQLPGPVREVLMLIGR